MSWLRTHKPKTTNDICGNSNIIKKLTQSIINKNNVVVYGTHGIGKKLTINCILHKLGVTPDDIYNLNASHDRSIKIIRKELASFLKYQSINGKYVFVKDIINLSHGTQHGLCGLMDSYKNVTFIFCTNTYENIIESLQSRCSYFEFQDISRKERDQFFTTILDKEGIEYTIDIFDIIDKYIKNDIRKSLIILQNSVIDSNLTVNQLMSVMKSPFSDTIDKIITYTRQKKKKESIQEIRTLLEHSYNHSDIIKFMFDYCIVCDTLTDQERIQYLEHIGETKISIYQGIYSAIQLDKLVIRLCSV